MTDRLAALAAAVMLAVTLAACGAADDKANGTAPDTTPNGSITTQPDTNGTDTGSAKDDLNGGRSAQKHAHMRGEQPPPNVGFAAGGFIAPTLFAFCIICTGKPYLLWRKYCIFRKTMI